MSLHLLGDIRATVYKTLLLVLATTTSLGWEVRAESGEIQSTAPRLSGHVLPALSHASVSHRATNASPLTLTFILNRDDEAGFQQYLNEVYDPKSPTFRHFLTQAQLTERFGPSQASFDEVVAYLGATHLTVLERSANRMTLTAIGARADAESAFDVHFDDYMIGGQSFFANDRDPQLPAHVAPHVQAIAGLTNLAVPQPAVQKWPSGPYGQATWYALCANYAINGGPINAGLGSGIFTATIFDAVAFSELIAVLNLLDAAVNIAQASDLSSSGTGQQYLQCVNSYNTTHGYPALGGRAFVSANQPLAQTPSMLAGAGQKIGLLEFDTFLPSDVQNYVALMGAFSGPATNVSQVNVNGGATLGAGQDEVLLDIDDVLTAAPGAAIIVYDAPPSTSYQALFNAMINGGVDVISNSWTYCEDQTTLADVTSIDSILESAAASGISVFNGAGDSGSTCLDGGPNVVGVPSDSPHATAVGGTSRLAYPGFTYGTETWWDGSGDTPATGQGGFGVSRYFARPTYQNGSTSSAARSVPDVAANADPRYGVVICQASAGGCPNGGFYGGTSSATPIWAAYAAVLNQTNGSDFGFLNSQIYTLGTTLAFHTPSSMGSDFAHVGLGSPNLPHLYMGLSGQTAGAVSPTVSTVRAFAQTTYSPASGSGLPTLGFADGMNQTFVVVTLFDANGFPVGGKNVSLTASSGGTTVFTGSTLADTSSGVAIFYVKDTTPQTLIMTAADSSDGVPLSQTATIQFIVPPATSGNISAFTDAEPADGASTDVITVTLVDASNKPTPGKSVVLTNIGNSLVVGSNPVSTDVNGQAQFSVSDTVQEEVVYTATDLSDGSVAVPGSTTVTFNASGGDNCGLTYDVSGTPNIGPGPGYAMTPYATGFVPLVTDGGGLTNGCRGASGLAFDGAGNLFVSDMHDGNIYEFPPGGGVADATTLVTPTPLGPDLESLTFGNDGKLYGAIGYTTGNFTTGAVIEVNPTTGAFVRTVSPQITCASFIATDPASGDLFVNDACAGGGSENGSVWRVSNPGSATPHTTVYASTPGINGGLTFAPGGTLYMISYRDNGGAGGVVEITGTGAASPGQVTVLSDIVGPALGIVASGNQGDGDAQSLILAANTTDGFTTGVRSFDVTQTPVTTTSLVMRDLYANVEVLGPDGCMYASVSVTVYRVTNADGSCPLNVDNALLTLSPATAPTSLQQSQSSNFTVTLHNATAPVGTPVYFAVTGPNGQISQALLDANGQATFNLVGINTGTDTVTATATINAINVTSNPGVVTWTSGPHETLITFNPGPNSGRAGFPTSVAATLHDISVQPPVPIVGASILFGLSGLSCAGVTDGNGIARCNLTIAFIGTSTLVASYAANTTYTSSSASELFSTSDLIFANGFEGLH